MKSILVYSSIFGFRRRFFPFLMLASNFGNQDGKLLYGKPIVDQIYQRIAHNVQCRSGQNPSLAILATNFRPDTEIYVKKKIKALTAFGFNYILRKEMETEKQADLIELWNKDPEIDGILIQLPLGPRYPSELVNLLKWEKDIDGLRLGNPFFKPCTASAIMELIRYYAIPLLGKEVVVVGKGQLVGIPISLLLLEEGATVTVVHKSTKLIDAHIKRADVIISAAGHPGLIHSGNIKTGSTIIDVGISRQEDKIKGDVEITKELLDKVSFITPVPGGIGPITVAKLLENLTLTLKLDKK